MSPSRIVHTATLALCLAGLTGASRANAAEAGLEGAWLEQGSECREVFVRAGKGAAFKKPVNVFAPAFIVAGNRLRTPQASCTIKGVKPAGDRRLVSLQCATSVAVDDVKAILAPAADGTLVRYLNDEDTTGSRYRRCVP